MESARALLATQSSLELIAEDLRFAQVQLGAITGEFTSDDLLGEIFSNFCVGKWFVNQLSVEKTPFKNVYK